MLVEKMSVNVGLPPVLKVFHASRSTFMSLRISFHSSSLSKPGVGSGAGSSCRGEGKSSKGAGSSFEGAGRSCEDVSGRSCGGVGRPCGGARIS